MKNNKYQKWIEQDYELSVYRVPDTGIINRLIQTVLAAIGTYSCIYCFSSTFSLPVSEIFKYTSLFYLAIIVALESWLLKKNWKLQWASRISVLIFWMIGNKKNLDTGFRLIANMVIDVFSSYTGYNIKKFFIGQVLFREEWFYVSAVLEIIFIIMAWLAVQVIVKHKSVWIYVIPSLIFAAPAFVVGMVPPWRPFLVYVIFLFGLFGLSAIRLRADKKKLYGKEEEIYFARLKIKTGILLMAAATCTFIVVAVAFGKGKYEKVQWIAPVKKSIQSGKWLDDVTSFIKQKKNEGAGGLSDGKLGRYNALKFDRQTDLEVTIGDFDGWRQPIYLKAFLGNDYQGNKWEKDTAEKEKKEELLKKGFSVEEQTVSFYNLLNIFDSIFRGGEQTSVGLLYNYYKLKGIDVEKNGNFMEYIGSNIHVKDVAADKKVKYRPYFSAETEAGNMFTYLNPDTFQTPYFVEYLGAHAEFRKNIMDYLESKQQPDELKKEMEIYWNEGMGKILNKDLDNEDKRREERALIEKLGIYQEAEKEYRKFVSETYTLLPEKFCKKIVQESKKKYEENKNKDKKALNFHTTYGDNQDLEDSILSGMFWSNDRRINTEAKKWAEEQAEIMRKIKFVQDYLKENASYSLSPGKLEGEDDFIENFIFEKKKGYCAHFASTAVIMLRALDIPARYVEGYVVKPEDIKDGVPDGGSITYTQYRNSKAGTTRTKKVSIKDTNAHAWPEIYMDGYGWIPVEVTPGYDPEKDKKKETLSPLPSPSATAPQVTETPAKSTATPEIGKNNQETDTNTSGFKIKALWRVLELVLFIAAVYIIILLREGCIRGIRKIRLKHMEQKEAALTLFRRSDKILRFMIKYKLPGFYKKEFNNMTADAIYGANRDLNIILSGWLQISISECMDIVYKLRFSDEDVSREEYDKLEELYKNVRKYLYHDFCMMDQGKDRGFWGKWFYNFYCRRLKIY